MIVAVCSRYIEIWPICKPGANGYLVCEVSHPSFELTLHSFFPGWLHKEVKNSPKMSSLKLKKRWFVLTHNSLDYYKSSEKNALKLGTLVLNSLCSVVPPDEKIFKETGKRCGVLRTGWAWDTACPVIGGVGLLGAKEWASYLGCLRSPPPPKKSLLLIYLLRLSVVSYVNTWYVNHSKGVLIYWVAERCF